MKLPEANKSRGNGALRQALELVKPGALFGPREQAIIRAAAEELGEPRTEAERRLLEIAGRLQFYGPAVHRPGFRSDNPYPPKIAVLAAAAEAAELVRTRLLDEFFETDAKLWEYGEQDAVVTRDGVRYLSHMTGRPIDAEHLAELRNRVASLQTDYGEASEVASRALGRLNDAKVAAERWEAVEAAPKVPTVET